MATAVAGNDSDILTNAGGISTNAGGISTNATAISNEVTRATAAEGLLDARADSGYCWQVMTQTFLRTLVAFLRTRGISTNATAISNEVTRATAAEGLLDARADHWLLL